MVDRSSGIVQLPRENSYIAEFDGLRAFSILSVFVAHSEFLRAVPHLSWLEYGRLGVDLFFVLSGFLITRILLNSKSKKNYLRNFYARRALRIWPLYYAVLAAVFLLTHFLLHDSAAHGSWPYLLLYVQNLKLDLIMPFGLQPTWSLAIEEQFYFTWPILVLLLGERFQRLVLWFCITFSIALRVMGHHQHASLQFVHSFTLCRLDALAFGCLAAIWLTHVNEPRTWGKRATYMLIFGLAGIILARLILGEQSTIIGYTCVAVAFTGLLGITLLSSSERSILGNVLRLPALRYIGKISYGMYLLHMPLFLLVQRVVLALKIPHSAAYNLGIGLLQIGIATIAASVSWRFFESPILSYKKRFQSANA